MPTSSGIALITTAEDGQNAIVVVPGANGELSPRELEKHLPLIREAGIILTQLEIPLETIEYLAMIVRRENIPLDARSRSGARAARVAARERRLADAERNRNADAAATQRNRTAQRRPRRRRAATAANKAAATCCSNSASAAATSLSARGERTLVPSYRVKAIDTTAAGDAFNGAFATALLRGSDPVASVKYAAAVAAISVTRHGAQPSMPTPAEVEAFLRDAKPVCLTILNSRFGTRRTPPAGGPAPTPAHRRPSNRKRRRYIGKNWPVKASNTARDESFSLAGFLPKIVIAVRVQGAVSSGIAGV